MSLEAFDVREAETPIGRARQRCADCGGFRLLESDGRCFSCLTEQPIPVRAHFQKPRYRVWIRRISDRVVVFTSDVVQEQAVVDIRDMWKDEDHVFSVDPLNGKEGVLR